MPEKTEMENENKVTPPESTPPKEKDKFKPHGKDKNAAKNEELEKLRGELTDATDKYLRLAAEYDNFRKRSQRERDTIYPEATAAAVTSLLPVADNFQRALAAECTDLEYKKGAEMTFKSLEEALSRLNVESFGKPGDTFDPNLHNAVMHVEDEAQNAQAITEVFQCGYRMGERVLRCAMVKVAN